MVGSSSLFTKRLEMFGRLLSDSGLLGPAGLEDGIEKVNLVRVQGSDLVLQSDRFFKGLLLGGWWRANLKLEWPNHV